MFTKNFFLKLYKTDKIDIYTSILTDGRNMVLRNLTKDKIILDDDFFTVKMPKKMMVICYNAVLRVDIK